MNSTQNKTRCRTTQSQQCRQRRPQRTRYAFTLVELLVALTVSSVILSAVAALAFAVTSANEASNELALRNTQARAAQLRITDIVRSSRLICGVPASDVVIWANDDGYSGDGANDNQVNGAEIVFLELWTKQVNIVTYVPGWWSELWFRTRVFTMSEMQTGWAKWELMNRCYRIETVILPTAANIQRSLDTAVPYTQRMTLSFDLTADNITRNYQFTAALRGYAGHLLDDTGRLVTTDDD